MSEPTFEASEPIGEPITPSFQTAVTRKQNFNIYSVMLIISFVCLLVGTLLLWLELSKYGAITDSPWNTTEGRPESASIDLIRGMFRV